MMMQNKTKQILRKISLTVLILGFLCAGSSFAWAKTAYQNFDQSERDFLYEQFSDDPGLQKRFIKRIFNHVKLKKIPIITDRNVYNGESKRNYEDFLSNYSIRVGYRFSRKWRTVLKKASKRFDVDKEVLVAILLVETGFGNLLGRYPVISVFSSILVDGSQYIEDYEKIKNPTKEEQYKRLRLEKKTKWAKIELQSLLKIIQKTSYGPFDIKGSFAGAFGIPQFLPSSFLKWGYDSDNNGSVNLFLIPDAIYSTANYLKSHGWEKGLSRHSNKQVIWNYNNSTPYVEAVIKLAQKIKNYSVRKIVSREKRKSAFVIN